MKLFDIPVEFYTCLHLVHVRRLALQQSLKEVLTDIDGWKREIAPAVDVAFSTLGNRGETEAATRAGEKSNQRLSVH